MKNNNKEYPFIADNGQRYKIDPILGNIYEPTPFKVKDEIIDGKKYRFETKKERDDFFNKQIAELLKQGEEDDIKIKEEIKLLSKKDKDKYLSYSFEEISTTILNSNILDEEEAMDTIHFLEDEWIDKESRLIFILGLVKDGVLKL